MCRIQTMRVMGEMIFDSFKKKGFGKDSQQKMNKLLEGLRITFIFKVRFQKFESRTFE